MMLNSVPQQYHPNVYSPKTRIDQGERVRNGSPSTHRTANIMSVGLHTSLCDDGERDEIDGDEPGTRPRNSLTEELLQQGSGPHTVSSPPRYPRYEDREVRKRTYDSWTNAFPDVQLLIASGFFFLGGRDSVQCFQCGIILHSWEADDTPDGEHVKHNPNCSFVQKKLQANRETGSNVREQRAIPPLAPALVIKKVARLGHSEELIIRAFGNLRLAGENNITTHKLLDAVYSIEDEEFNAAHRQAAMLVVSDDDEVEHIASPGAEGGHSVSYSHPVEEQAKSHELEGAAEKNPSSDSDRLKELEMENENLRQRTLCRVCDDRPATELFLPCGHLACCDQCTDKLELCPFCRKRIERTYHVFMP